MEPARQATTPLEDQRPIACLGEAIVDLICERNLALSERAGSFIPWPGGALANVAVQIARQDVPVALVGGVGADRWGGWLRRDLEREGVETRWLAELRGADTPVALVEFGPDNEPAFQVYGEHIGPTMAATSGFLEEAVAGSQALVVGSNTMVGETERVVTRRAVELARGSGRPVLLDPNYRPGRWQAVEAARECCREMIAAADVVKMNRQEAELVTGLGDPRDAARALAGMGPELAVVTAGTEATVTAGAAAASHQPEIGETVSPLGAGDAFMGALAAGLARRSWDLARAGEVLPEASRAAASVCRIWGAR